MHVYSPLGIDMEVHYLHTFTFIELYKHNCTDRFTERTKCFLTFHKKLTYIQFKKNKTKQVINVAFHIYLFVPVSNYSEIA